MHQSHPHLLLTLTLLLLTTSNALTLPHTTICRLGERASIPDPYSQALYYAMDHRKNEYYTQDLDWAKIYAKGLAWDTPSHGFDSCRHCLMEAGFEGYDRVECITRVKAAVYVAGYKTFLSDGKKAGGPMVIQE